MSPLNNSRTAGKRIGRKRKPPLAPGPALQFVVAGHPDEFRAGETMRNIRSHVMYKHRERRGSSPSEATSSREGSRAVSATPAPSPKTTDSDGILDSTFLAPMSTRPRDSTSGVELYGLDAHQPLADPLRALINRIIRVTTAVPARSAPPILEEASEYPFLPSHIPENESLENMKQEYIGSTVLFCHGR